MRKRLVIGGIIVVALLLGMIVVLQFLPGGQGVPEEQGIVRIKALPEYAALVQRDGVDQVRVRAVDLREARSAAFLTKIDPGFRAQPGCIIVLEGHTHGYVYQLDEAFNIVHRVTLDGFQEGTRHVAPETMAAFYQALK